jgi:hypothetical protein
MKKKNPFKTFAKCNKFYYHLRIYLLLTQTVLQHRILDFKDHILYVSHFYLDRMGSLFPSGHHKDISHINRSFFPIRNARSGHFYHPILSYNTWRGVRNLRTGLTCHSQKASILVRFAALSVLRLLPRLK